jgi:hypothetical protein
VTEICAVKVDKQVSCDGGLTWTDDNGLVSGNEDGTDSCLAALETPILVKYRAQNTGNVGVFNCTLGESNIILGPGVTQTFDLVVGADPLTFDDTQTDPQICSVAVEGGEPDRATLICECSSSGSGTFTASVYDEANFDCVGQGACRMTGGHNVFTGTDSVLVPGGAETLTINQVRVKRGVKFQLENQIVEYTTGGQIGAPNAQGCCEVPPDAKCIDGLCVGGPDNGSECTNNGGCSSSHGRQSDCPWGDWEHNHHQGAVSWEGGSFGNANSAFAFHSGTAAAPQAAFIQQIKCDDPGWCVQARCAPFKQIYWEGTGSFHNYKNIDNGLFKDCVVPETKNGKPASIHYYKAHVGDFGEPAGSKQNASDDPDVACNWTTSSNWDLDVAACELTNAAEPIDGISCTEDSDCTSLKGGAAPGATCEGGLCVAREPFDSEGGDICRSCADWYEIEIHCDASPDSAIIYKVGNFIREGNFQIHPEVGTSCHDGFGTVTGQ